MKKIIIICLLQLVSVMLFSQSSFDPASLLKGPVGVPRLVNDFTGNTLTPDQQQTLENKLVAFDDSTSTQIAVIIIPTLGDYEINDYNTKLGRAWGVGGKEFSNGVVLLIVKDDRELNIATGYGVEGALPDITAKHIIEDVIVPNFKGSDYYRGIDEGTNAIIKAVQGEYSTPRTKTKSPGGKFPFIIILIILFLLFSGRGNNKGGGFMSRRGYRGLSDTIFWGTLLGGGRGGGGFGGGGGWSGGGGGFGGFGGGGFGGGGASGRW